MDTKKVIGALNEALEMELATAMRNLHYSFMIFGPGRKPLVEFFRAEVTESIGHAAKMGEKITALGGRPTVKVSAIHEPQQYDTESILRESLKHEEGAVKLYSRILELVQDDTPLRVLFEDQVLQEQEHVEELRKYLRPQPA